MLDDTVDLPVPPFWETTDTIFIEHFPKTQAPYINRPEMIPRRGRPIFLGQTKRSPIRIFYSELGRTISRTTPMETPLCRFSFEERPISLPKRPELTT